MTKWGVIARSDSDEAIQLLRNGPRASGLGTKMEIQELRRRGSQ